MQKKKKNQRTERVMDGRGGLEEGSIFTVCHNIIFHVLLQKMLAFG